MPKINVYDDEVSTAVALTTDISTTISISQGELWWGGAVADGKAMPFGGVPISRDLASNSGHLRDATDGANQSAPLLLSSAGGVVWSELPFTFSFDDSQLVVTGAAVTVETAPGETLRDAFQLASARYFPASGATPARELFTGPQYNTWIEAPYAPTQEAVIAYARRLLDAGLPPGVLMIDDNWAPDYGDWQFDSRRFPDPRAMVAELHSLGFAVMLWVVPYISPDGAVFRELRDAGHLLRGADGEVAIRRWWNGYSAILDLTDPAAVDWFRGRLDSLRSLGIDGFKFDGGDIRDFRQGDLFAVASGPVGQTEAWGRLGLEYPFNEYRAGWKMGGQPLAQRLHDKPATWGADGLASLIPEGIAQGLIGHAFTCADMVGGGDIASFAPGAAVDQEQFVRYAQCAALFPMMQFSISPARVLDDRHLTAVREAIALRQTFLPEILRLVDAAAATGEPIIRPLAYHFAGFERVTDQFLLGEDILVAPVLEQGATSRSVVLPPGSWTDLAGTTFAGGVIQVAVDLGTTPVFRRS
ncbi:MAG: putative glycoside hydrolase [Glaciihabitans sp.]|nr:putative glycoside hydrolase [Glaciihabitans sp.]